MATFFSEILSDYFPSLPVLDEIPAGLASNEMWMLRRRKAIPKRQPSGFFRPQGFVPEPYGYTQGIPLYRFHQTRAYTPKPATVAAQEFFDLFVASQNRHRHSKWDDGKRRNRPDVKPGWKTHEKYLSRAKIRDHLRGKEIYGCWGNQWTSWFALDLDYHGGDPDLFLALLEILKELPDFFPGVRWIYFLNRNGISGLHLIGVLPKPRLLQDIRRDVQKVLVYLEDENINSLEKYGVDHPLAKLEIYPATNHNFRLPYAADRITVTDEWLNKSGAVSLKPNLVKFMAFIKDKERQAVSLDDVIKFIRANIQWKPAKEKPSNLGVRRKSGRGHCFGKIEPLKGRHLEFITGVVLGTEAMPEDTIGCWAAPALRHLMLVDGLDTDEALSKIGEFYQMIPDDSFSDRLSSGNIGELLRADAYTAEKIQQGNLYQPNPEESTEIFARVKARCQQIGFVFGDPSTWHVLDNRKGFQFDIRGMDFSLNFEEKLAVKEPGAAMLKCDIPSVYQAAHCIKAFVTKYPGKEMPASLVPHLCSGLPITWHVPSDNGTRCKKAEKFLGLLCSLGIIKVIKPKQWFGHGNPNNRAARYGLPQDSCRGGSGGECIYIRDNSPFTVHDITQFILEIERLNGPWKPQYHSSG